MAATSARSGSSATARQTIRPMRPAAPSTPTRIIAAPLRARPLRERADDRQRHGRGRARRPRPRRASSQVTRLDPLQDLVDREDLAVADLGACRCGDMRPLGVLQRQHQRALHVALRPLELLLGHALRSATSSSSSRDERERPLSRWRASCPRRRRTARSRRTSSGSCTPSRPGRASRGSPGTGARTCRRRAPSSPRRTRTVRGRSRDRARWCPGTVCACSVFRFRTTVSRRPPGHAGRRFVARVERRDSSGRCPCAPRATRKLVVREVARGGDHEVRGPVQAIVEALHLVPGHRRRWCPASPAPAGPADAPSRASPRTGRG